MAHRAEEGIKKQLSDKNLSSRAGELLGALVSAPDRESALLLLWRFCEEASAEVLARVDPLLLGAIFSHSESFSERLVARPEDALFLEEAYEPERSFEDFWQMLGEPEEDIPSLQRQLRRFRNRAYLRIALRDVLGLADIPSLTREISRVAEVVLAGAVAGIKKRQEKEIGVPLAHGETPCGFVVLGMGKLGGEELNFSSDIDLIYVYETDNGSAGPLSLHAYFTRFAEILTRVVSEVTEEGFAFRVDLRLRPEGTRGALVNSLRSLEAYYEAFGRTWERAALLKARPVAGDLALGEQVLAMLQPYIYRRSLDLKQLKEIRELNRQIKQELNRRSTTVWDVKLGRGGIREIEFFVQALQLVYAGREVRLREKNTLRALDRLLYAGRISAREHASLRDAYIFFRRVEHRLQLLRERQTHTLPSSTEALLRLARSLGYQGESPEKEILEEISLHRQKVSTIFETLFAGEEEPQDPLFHPAKGGAFEIFEEIPFILAKDTPPEERIKALSSLGFSEPEGAERLLASLEKRPFSPFSPSAPPEVASLAQFLLTEVVQSPNPDRALLHLSTFIRPTSGIGYIKLFAQNPHLGRLLVNLFGTSDLLADYFVRHPDLIESLLSAGRAELRRKKERLKEALCSRMEKGSDLEERLRIMRRFHQEETLRIALHDIGGELDWGAIQEELSDLAEVLVQTCLEEAIREDAARSGEEGPAAPIAILGMGKLGGRELGYKSDLDLVFLYDGAPLAVERCVRIAQRTIFFLTCRLEEGLLYEIDTRLRPSGNQGALVASVEGFARYHGVGEGNTGAGQHAQLWEEQALIRARGVAGDKELLKRAVHIAKQAAFRPREKKQVFGEIRRMRKRMEEEIPKRGTFHLKASAGGMVDVEFAVQALQLIYGHQGGKLCSPNTQEALAALQEAGYVSPEAARDLGEAYTWLGRLSSRVRLLYDQSISEIRDTPAALRGIARSLGFSSVQAFREELERLRSLVRARFDEIVSA